MISIKDIAKAAGVSHPTVSRALRDSPLISAETKALIQRLRTRWATLLMPGRKAWCEEARKRWELW